MRATIAAIATLLALTAAAAAQPAARPSAEHGTIDRRVLDPRQDYSAPSIDDSSGRLVVSYLAPMSTWADLGLRTGDIIVAIDGHQVISRAGLESRAAALAVKDVVYIEIIRKRKPRLLRREVRGPIVEALDEQVATPAPAATDAPAAAELDRLVVPRGTNTWAVDVDAILADPTRFARQARIVPSVQDGEPNGFKLYAVHPDSVYTRLGLQSGDTITAIGGHRLTTMEQVLEVYTRVRNATGKVEVHLTRRGKPVVHTYIRMKPPATPKP